MTPAPARFIAVDWGTTNRRVFLIEDGAVVRTEHDERGVTAVPTGAFESEAADIRARFGDSPMLMAGMVGSTIGWRVAPYVPAPCGMADLARAMLWIDTRTAIVPGVSLVENGRGDVMRGEEVQLFGALATGDAPGDALLCHPGTHCKWVEMAGGAIARFTTAMTGELFALIRAHGVLASQLGAPAALGDAFEAGVREGGRRDLTASLFGIRAASILGLRDDADAASFASGLIIGSDVAARLTEDRHEAIHVLADPHLARLYAAAIAAHGRATRIVDGQGAFVAGMIEIARLIA